MLAGRAATSARHKERPWTPTGLRLDAGPPPILRSRTRAGSMEQARRLKADFVFAQPYPTLTCRSKKLVPQAARGGEDR